MTKRKKGEVTDDNVTSIGEIRYFDLISIDLIIKILSRLPAKSIAKCRCVSKLWSSIIRRPNYNQLFPIKSPSLLFIGEPHHQIQKKLSFYSSPHHQIHDKKSSFINPIHLTDTITDYYRLCPPVAGLVCRQQSGVNSTYAVICNPATGKYVTTPKVTKEGFETNVEIYFGYDPVDKVFKVLSLTWSLRDGSHKYQVLTLGTENLSWRKIQCCTFHYPPRDNGDGICINGVLYYTAALNSKKRTIVCFDVRFEKFSFINIPDEYLERKICEPLILIDYNGELGVIHCSFFCGSNSFALWVLKNAEEQKWSRHHYKIPHMLHLRLTTPPVFSAGMISTYQIVFYNMCGRNPFYIFCYNLEKNVITRVGFEVPTLDWVECGTVEIFSNFVEDAKLMF